MLIAVLSVLNKFSMQILLITPARSEEKTCFTLSKLGRRHKIG